MCYENNIPELLSKWGDLPIDSSPGVDFNCHPFVTVLNMQRMQAMNLAYTVHSCSNLDEMSELFDMSFIPDPLAKAFRTRSREREVKRWS